MRICLKYEGLGRILKMVKFTRLPPTVDSAKLILISPLKNVIN